MSSEMRPKSLGTFEKLAPGTRFLRVPKLFGWQNFLCIYKGKESRGTELCRYFNFCSLYNIWKDQLYRISRSEFYEWLFGPEKRLGLFEKGPHTGIFSIVLQWERARGRTGHMIITIIKGGFSSRLRFKEKKIVIYNFFGPQFWGKHTITGK